MINCGAPASKLSFNLLLILIISTSLCVKSSSDFIPVSSVIDGLIVIGGTCSTVNINHCGLILFVS